MSILPSLIFVSNSLIRSRIWYLGSLCPTISKAAPISSTEMKPLPSASSYKIDKRITHWLHSGYQFQGSAINMTEWQIQGVKIESQSIWRTVTKIWIDIAATWCVSTLVPRKYRDAIDGMCTSEEQKPSWLWWRGQGGALHTWWGCQAVMLSM